MEYITSLKFERSNEKAESWDKWLIVSKRDDLAERISKLGRNKSDKEKKAKLQEIVDSNNETISRLQKGSIINLYNNPVRTNDILKDIRANGFEENIYYRIQPITSVKRNVSRYGYEEAFFVHEFEILNIVTTKEQLIDQLEEDCVTKIFLKNTFNNDFFNDWDTKTEFFEIAKSKYNQNISLYDIVRTKYDSRNLRDYKPKSLSKILPEYLEKGYLDFGSKYQTPSIVINMLLKEECYDILKDYLEHIGKLDISEEYKENKHLQNELIQRSSNPIIQKICNEWKIKDNRLKLEIMQNGYSQDNFKYFNNMDEVKTYLVQEWKFSFDQVKDGNLDKLEYSSEDDYYNFRLV